MGPNRSGTAAALPSLVETTRPGEPSNTRVNHREPDLENHHRGLDWDLPRLLQRRGPLKLVAGAGPAARGDRRSVPRRRSNGANRADRERVVRSGMTTSLGSSTTKRTWAGSAWATPSTSPAPFDPLRVRGVERGLLDVGQMVDDVAGTEVERAKVGVQVSIPVAMTRIWREPAAHP